MNDIYGILLSTCFAFFIIFLAELLCKYRKWQIESTRKFIHIGVGHWWLIAMITIDSIYYALLPPLLFTFLNYYSYKCNIITSMERRAGKKDLGTVYYALALFILVALTWQSNTPNAKHIGAIGILILAYGDGLAALVGEKYHIIPFTIYDNHKSISGSLTMFLASFIVSAVVLAIIYPQLPYLKIALMIAFVATILEILTPWGLDNLTIAIGTVVFANFILAQPTNSEIFSLLYRLCWGGALTLTITCFSWYKKSLSISGAIGALLLGIVIAVTSGIFGVALLMAFFISSTAWGRYKKNKKAAIADQFDKTGERDIWQVMANGGIGGICSILFYFTQDFSYLIIMGVTFATANADTWATELGILNSKDPFSLRTFKKAKKGTSGAISIFGSLMSLLGALFIALCTSLLLLWQVPTNNHLFAITLWITLAGFLGAFIDSVLGATIQAVYYCEELQQETEKTQYKGYQTQKLRGFPWINNDVVNFISIGLASILFFIVSQGEIL